MQLLFKDRFFNRHTETVILTDSDTHCFPAPALHSPVKGPKSTETSSHFGLVQQSVTLNGPARFHHLPAKHRPNLHKKELGRLRGQNVKVPKSTLSEPELETNRIQQSYIWVGVEPPCVKSHHTNKLFIHSDHPAVTSSMRTHTNLKSSNCLQNKSPETPFSGP